MMRLQFVFCIILILGSTFPQKYAGSSQDSRFLPENLEILSTENVSQLKQLAVLGRGILEDVDWSPDGKTIAVRTRIGTWLYDAANLSNNPTFINTADHLVFSTDWSKVASRSWTANAIDLWNFETGEVTDQLLSPFNSPMDPILFSPNGQYLAANSYSAEARLIIWDVINKEPIHFDEKGSIFLSSHLAFSPDNRMLVYTYSRQGDGVGHLVDLRTRQVIELPGHGNSTYEATFSSTGDTVLIKGEDGIRQWDSQTGEFLGMPLPIFNDRPSGRFIWNKNRDLLALGLDHPILVDAGLQDVLEIPVERTVHSWTYNQQFTDDSSRLLFVDGFYDIVVWNIEQEKEELRLSGHENEIFDMVLSPDNTRLVSIGEDNTLRMWNLQDGAQLDIVHYDAFRDARVTSDGQLMAENIDNEGKYNHIVATLWNLETGERQEFHFESALEGKLLVRNVHYSSATDTFILESGANWQNYLWDESTDTSDEFLGMAVVLSSDGKTLAIANPEARGCVINLLNLETDELVELGHCEGYTTQMQFNEAGTRLYVLDSDYECPDVPQIQIWGVQSRRLNFLIRYDDLCFVDSFLVSPNEIFIAAYPFIAFNDGPILTYIARRSRFQGLEFPGSCCYAFNSASTQFAFGNAGPNYIDGLYVWDASELKVTPLAHGELRVVNDLEFLPDKNIIVVDQNPYLTLWNTDTHELLNKIHVHNWYHTYTWGDISISNDGTLVFMNGIDGVIRIFGVPPTEE